MPNLTSLLVANVGQQLRFHTHGKTEHAYEGTLTQANGAVFTFTTEDGSTLTLPTQLLVDIDHLCDEL